MNSKFNLIFIAFSLMCTCWFCAGNTESDQSQKVYSTASEFFSTFADRSDWEKMCSFYREDVRFEDVMLQLKLDSLWQFKRFYNWEDTTYVFEKLSPDQEHLVVESLLVNDSMAVAHGHFNPFIYAGERVETEWGMDFTIWLFFDEEQKIIRQIDWIEYDPSVLESVVKRCRENGHEAIPEWLDLSRKE